MKLSELIYGIPCEVIFPVPVTEYEITDVTAACGRVKKGSLFAALRGQKHDGNDFIAEALSLGASAILTEKRPSAPLPVPVIVAGGVKTVFSRLSARMYASDATSKIIAVTGTNGKTTVATTTACILAATGAKTAVISTAGVGFYGRLSPSFDGMTTPIPEELFRSVGELSRAGAEYIVLEVSSQGIAEGRLDGLSETQCAPKTAIFTNLSPEHLDYHTGMDDYFAVKTRLFTDFGFENCVINIDGEYGRRLAEAADGKVITVGKGGDYGAGGITYGASGVDYAITTPRMRLRIRCPALGEYMAENTLSAAVAAMTEGVNPQTVADALAAFRGVRGRMERVDTERFFASVYIDFAHTPKALETLLKSARSMHGESRIVLVFGCGGDRDRQKRPVMGALASKYADFTVITSDNSRTERTEDIITEIESGFDAGADYTVISSRAEAIEYVIRNAREGDVILLSGKGHETFEDKNGIKTYFDEREIVKNALDKLNGSR